MDITAFFAAVIRQDAAAMEAYFHEDAEIFWHCTNERFTLAEYIRVNCDYPGDWAGELERVEPLEDGLLAVGRVYPADRSASFHVVSMLRLRAGKIARLDEYWADDGPPPAWRQAQHIGRPIR